MIPFALRSARILKMEIDIEVNEPNDEIETKLDTHLAILTLDFSFNVFLLLSVK